MGRFRAEYERDEEQVQNGRFYVIRDTVTGYLVVHKTLRVPERYRSERRARQRLSELETQEQAAGREAPPGPR
ncbi:MAG TPA: hypothetical protein VIA06_11000 [Candidatus Dormibacteraeota bacterium]|jgi:hypothetical protein|nr:hypothetical protein [Candidatus Dormibacteraeota bacterium]